MGNLPLFCLGEIKSKVKLFVSELYWIRIILKLIYISSIDDWIFYDEI